MGVIQVEGITTSFDGYHLRVWREDEEASGAHYYLEGELHMFFKSAMRGARRELGEEWDVYQDYCPGRYGKFKEKYLK